MRQSSTYYGLGFRVGVLEIFLGVLFLLGSGPAESGWDAIASSQSESSYFTETCSGSEAGSYLRLIDFFITQL
jgi:hypothetical protein